LESALSLFLWSSQHPPQPLIIQAHSAPNHYTPTPNPNTNPSTRSIEAMGMSLPYSSSIPAEDSLKLDECRLAGK